MGAKHSKMLRVSNVHCLKYDSEVLMHWICTALNINHVKKTTLSYMLEHYSSLFFSWLK